MTKADYKEFLAWYMSSIGKKGGQSRSDAKVQAARKNALKKKPKEKKNR